MGGEPHDGVDRRIGRYHSGSEADGCKHLTVEPPRLAEGSRSSNHGEVPIIKRREALARPFFFARDTRPIMRATTKGLLMDEDIRDNLKELSKHIEDVARQVGSTKIDVTGLTEMSETLRLNADTVETYVRIQKDRYIE